jgi:exodeoxyribonuclease VII small subunit
MAKLEASAPDSGECDEVSEVDFETALAEIEQIVARLEGGQLGLTESLEQYEAGIKQLKRCQTLLDSAEQRVSMLSGFDSDGNPIVQPMPGLDATSPDSGKVGPKRKRSRSAAKAAPKKGREDAAQSPDPDPNSVDDSPGLF